MNYSRSMMLISLLYQSADAANREILSKVFHDTISKANEFDELRKALESTVFFEPLGKTLYDEAQQLAANSFSEIENVAQNLMKIQVVLENIERETGKTDEMMQAPSFSNKAISAVSRSRIDSYVNYQKEIASGICYYLLVMDGVEPLRNLRFNLSANLQELNEVVSRHFADTLLQQGKHKTLPVWTIEQVDFQKSDALQYTGYVLSYDTMSREQMKNDFESGKYRRIAPNIYSSNGGVMAKWIGIGNIVGGKPGEALSYLNADVMTSIPSSDRFNMDMPANQLMENIANAIGASCFCISPDELTHAMNRRGMIRAAADRRVENLCIICGRKLEPGNRIACNSHFKVNPINGY